MMNETDQRSDPEDPLQIQPYESSLFYPLLMIHRLGFVGGQLFFLSFGGVVVEARARRPKVGHRARRWNRILTFGNSNFQLWPRLCSWILIITAAGHNMKIEFPLGFSPRSPHQMLEL